MITTLYSFKGGVGRSMALANIAWLLYNGGFRVLMVDWDLEAPGLEEYFTRPCPDLKSKLREYKGLVHLVQEYRDRLRDANPSVNDIESLMDGVDIGEFVCTVAGPSSRSGASLSLLPAGFWYRGSRPYGELLKSLDWEEFYNRWAGAVFFEWFRKKLNAHSNFVLLDARTGLSDTAGTCVMHMADLAVILFAPNQQNVGGAERGLEQIGSPQYVEQRHKNRGDRRLLWLPVLARVSEEPSSREYRNRLDALMDRLLGSAGQDSPRGQPSIIPIPRDEERKNASKDNAQLVPNESKNTKAPASSKDQRYDRPWWSTVLANASDAVLPYWEKYSVGEHLVDEHEAIGGGNAYLSAIVRIVDLVLEASKTLEELPNDSLVPSTNDSVPPIKGARQRGSRRKKDARLDASSVKAPERKDRHILLHCADSDRDVADFIGACIVHAPVLTNGDLQYTNKDDKPFTITIHTSLQSYLRMGTAPSAIEEFEAESNLRKAVPIISAAYLQQFSAWNPMQWAFKEDIPRGIKKRQVLVVPQFGSQYHDTPFGFLPQSLRSDMGDSWSRLRSFDRQHLAFNELELFGWLETVFENEIEKKERKDVKAPSVQERSTERGIMTPVTSTADWTDEEVQSKYLEVRKQLDWDNTTGSAAKWWKAFEEENRYRMRLVLRLAEELQNRKATITEFFLAYVYSNTANIQANLYYLDYSRLKKEEERKKRDEAQREEAQEERTKAKSSDSDDK